MKRTLTESERTTITLALRVASEVYQQHAAESLAADPPVYPIANRFEGQVVEAQALADLIENAEQIEIEVQP